MPNLTVNLPHQLSRAEAKTRVEGVVAQLRRELSSAQGRVEDRWLGDTMDFKLDLAISQITGQVVVGDNLVHIDVVLPWLLAALAGTVRQRLEQEGQLALGHRATSSAKV